MEKIDEEFIKETILKTFENKEFNLLKLLSLSLKNENIRDFKTQSIIRLSIENNFQDIYKIINDDEKIRILLCCNWCSSKELCELWNKMSKGNYTWNNIQIVWREPYDYTCIINRPQDNLNIDLSKSILFRMEPNMETKTMWGEEWCNPKTEDFLFCGYHSLHLNNAEWHLSKTYEQLLNDEIRKNEEVCNILSAVLSDKYSDPGHIKRIDFIKFLECKGMNVHVFGGNKFIWKDYKGSLPSHQKDNALFQYKYTFNCENFSIKNYCTEKFYDAILSECLIFYNGCYTIRDSIDNRAFIYLELSNFEKDYEKIKRAIEENWWEQRLPYIKEAKKKILNEMQFFPRIEKIINDKK